MTSPKWILVSPQSLIDDSSWGMKKQQLLLEWVDSTNVQGYLNIKTKFDSIWPFKTKDWISQRVVLISNKKLLM